MDKTNRVIEICRRIEELEYQLACKDMMRNDADDARLELEELEEELRDIRRLTNQCKQCPWVIGDTRERDCGYPDCCA